MGKMGDNIAALKIATSKAVKTGGSRSFTLRDSVLFLLSSANMRPSELMDALMLDKTAVAHTMNGLLKDGYVIKASLKYDKRNIEYSITDAGREIVRIKSDEIEALFKNILTDEKEFDEALEATSDVLRLLSFLS